MIDYNSGRTWTNAPSGVRSARALAWLGALFSGVMFVAAICMLVTGSLFHTGLAGILLFGLYSLFFPMYVWLLVGFKRGVSAAYWVQMALSVIGLLAFPVGTLINGYVLYLWYKPETKAWFGV